MSNSRKNTGALVLALTAAFAAAACSDSSGPAEPAPVNTGEPIGTPAPPPPPPPVSTFAIDIRYVGTVTPRQREAVVKAVARWQSVITRDLASVPLNAPAGACFETQPAVKETIDDLLIFIEFIDMDGAGNKLGEAGPCYVRSDNMLPVMGYLKLDATDLEMMERRGTLDDVVLHEVGHVLGIGTMWKDNKLIIGAGTDDPRFTGGAALGSYRGLGGLDDWIPVENTGSEGTRDGHWRESVFGDELMTGYISSSANPLSALTVASLTDIGYGTNSGAASAYTLSAARGTVVLDLHKREKLVKPKFKVDKQGKQTKLAQ